MTAESVIDRQSAGRVVVVKLVAVGGAGRGDDDCVGINRRGAHGGRGKANAMITKHRIAKSYRLVVPRKGQQPLSNTTRQHAHRQECW